MQSIQAGTTATLVPDTIIPDTLGNGWVVILEKSDGTDDHTVGQSSGGNGPPQWAVYTQDSPNISIYVPTATPAGTYRAVSKHIVNGSPSGNMYNVVFSVTPAAIAPVATAPVLAASVQPGGVLLQCTVPSS